MLQGSWRLYINVVLIASILLALWPERWRSVAVTLLAVAAIVPTIPALGNFHLFTHYEAAPGDPNEYLPMYVRHFNDSSVLRNALVFAPSPITSVDTAIETASAEFPSFSLAVHRPRCVTLKQFYWPNVQYEADGRSLESKPDNHGFTTLEVPAGNYRLSARIRRSEIENVSLLISLVAFLIMLCGSCTLFYQTMKLRDRASVVCI